jgi:hypothetical protein
MQASTAYGAGAGMIGVTLAIGLVGGVIAGNILSPSSAPQAVLKVEQIAPVRSAAAADIAPQAVSYLAETQRAGFGAVLVTPAPAAQQTTASAEPSQPPSARAAALGEAKPPDASPPQPAQDAASTPGDSYAKAKDTDLKREAAQSRRAARHQRWAERRRHEPRDQSDWGYNDRYWRWDNNSRDVASGRRNGSPQMRMFGDYD